MPNSLDVAQAFDGALIEPLELESWPAVDTKLAAAAAAHADRDGWLPAHERTASSAASPIWCGRRRKNSPC